MSLMIWETDIQRNRTEKNEWWEKVHEPFCVRPIVKENAIRLSASLAFEIVNSSEYALGL